MNQLAWITALPLLSAVAGFLWGKPSHIRRMASALSSSVLVGLSILLFREACSHGVYAFPIDGWREETHWFLVADELSALILVLVSLVALLCQIMGFVGNLPDKEDAKRLPLVHLLVFGMNFSTLSGDFFGLVVGLEVVMLAACGFYVLRAKYLEIRQIVPIFAINFLGTALLILSLILAYVIFGTWDMALIASRTHALTHYVPFIIWVLLLLLGLAVKATFIPFLLGSQGAHAIFPKSTGVLLASIATKLVLYAFIRILGTVLPHDLSYVQYPLHAFWIVAAMVASRPFLKRGDLGHFLSSMLIGQIGLVILALVLLNQAGFHAAILLLVSGVIVDAALYLVSNSLHSYYGTDELDAMGELWTLSPGLGVLFLALILTLIGVPPASGFWGKYVLIQEGQGVANGMIPFGLTILTVLMFLSAIQVWREIFLKRNPYAKEGEAFSAWKPLAWLALILILSSFLAGMYAETFRGISRQCAVSALNRPAYHAAIMEVRR